MSVLKTEHYDLDGKRFSVKVSVDKEGDFTTTLPPEISEILIAAKISLSNNRMNNPGYFWADTLSGLSLKIGAVLAEYQSRETIEDKIVIRYAIQTACSYSIDHDGSLVPGPSYGDGLKWYGGTKDTHAARRSPYGLNIYAKPERKKVFRYKSGKEKTEYLSIYNETKKGTYLHELASFTSLSPPGSTDVNDLEYTEQTAKFFVDMLYSICKINEKIKDFLEPEQVQLIIDNGQKLLT